MDVFHWRTCTTGAVSPTDFVLRLTRCPIFSARTTPLSDPRLLLATTPAYLLLVFLSHRRFRHRPPAFAFTRPFVLVAATHNLFLSFSSLLMFLGALRAALHVARTSRIAATICQPPAAAVPSSIQAWLYIFYLSKFYELLDTFLLVLRGRPLTALHVWHHASVMYEVWAWLEWDVVVGVYGMCFNALVHVIMYAYYAAALLKIPFPFKRAITTTQIVQFLTGFALLVPYVWLHSTAEGCKGVPGLTVSALCNGSYLVLFLRFFRKTYSTDRAKEKTARIERGDGIRERTKDE